MTASILSVVIAFSPGNAESMVIKVVDSTKSTLDIAAYSFTSSKIAAAIEAASKRGVAVRIVIDKSRKGERASIAPRLTLAGAAIRFDAKHAIQHSKFMVSDSVVVGTGSFNYTYNAAHRNAENVVILYDAKSAELYAAEFAKHWGHAAP